MDYSKSAGGPNCFPRDWENQGCPALDGVKIDEKHFDLTTQADDIACMEHCKGLDKGFAF